MFIPTKFIVLCFTVAALALAFWGGQQYDSAYGPAARQVKAINSSLQQQGKVFNDKVVVGLCGKKGGKTASELGVFGPYAVQCQDGRVFLPGYSQKK